MKYKDLREWYEDTYKLIPKFYAFGDNQFEEEFKKFNEEYPEIKESDLVGVYGMYTTEEFFNLTRELYKSYKEQLRELYKIDINEFKKVLYYQLNNHEYIYSENDQEVLNAMEIDQQFLQENSLVDAYEETVKKYLNNMLENGCF